MKVALSQLDIVTSMLLTVLSLRVKLSVEVERYSQQIAESLSSLEKNKGVRISGSIFRRCTASDGGAMFIENCKLRIDKSIIRANVATGGAGGFQVGFQPGDQIDVKEALIMNSMFINNSAPSVDIFGSNIQRSSI